MPNFFNLSGGMNTKVGPLILLDSECELCKNYDLSELIGPIVKRPGFRYIGDDEVGGGSPGAVEDEISVHHFISSDSTKSGFMLGRGRIIQTDDVSTTLSGGVSIGDTTIDVADASNLDVGGRIEINGDIIAYTGITVNQLTGVTGVEKAHASGDIVTQWDLQFSASGTANKRARYVTFLDNVVIMRPGTTPASRDDFSAGTSSINTIGQNVKYGEVFQDRMYHLNDGTNLSRLYYSTTPVSGNISWDTTNNFVDINPEDGDEGRALKTAGERLLIFKINSLYTWTFGSTQSEKVYDVGTVAQETVQNVHGVTYFAHRTGVYAWNFGSASQPRFISRKVQKFIDAVPDATMDSEDKGLSAGFDNEHYYLSIGTVTIDSGLKTERTYTNCVLVYHIFLDKWSIYEMAVCPLAWAQFKQNNATFPVFATGGSTDKVGVFRFGIGNVDTKQSLTPSSDVSGVPIEAEYISKEIPISYPEKSTLESIHVASERAVGTNIFYRLDRGQKKAGKFESVNKQLTNRFTNISDVIEDKFNTIQMKFVDNSKNKNQVDGFAVEVKGSTETQKHGRD